MHIYFTSRACVLCDSLSCTAATEGFQKRTPASDASRQTTGVSLVALVVLWPRPGVVLGGCLPARPSARPPAGARLPGWVVAAFFSCSFLWFVVKMYAQEETGKQKKSKKKMLLQMQRRHGKLAHTHTHTVSDSSDTHTHTPGDICLTTKQFELMGLGSWGGKAHSLAHANRNNNGAQLLSGLRTIQSICSAWQIVKLKETLLTICLMPS